MGMEVVERADAGLRRRFPLGIGASSGEDRADGRAMLPPSATSTMAARGGSFLTTSSLDVSSTHSMSPSSSLASPFDSIRSRDRPEAHCEVEEIVELEWLPSPLRWRPSPAGRGGAHGPVRWSRHASTTRSSVPTAEEAIPSELAWLENLTGRRCYMLPAKALKIWANDAVCRWISVPDSRLPEAAELREVCWLEIRARVRCCKLSPGTQYGAYLVMRYADDTAYGLGFPLQEAVISVGGAQTSTRIVRLWRGGGVEGVCVPRGRGDGWMELEMGDFFVVAAGAGGGEDEVADVRLKGRQCLHRWWKSGLVVHGLEVRPMPEV